MQVIDEEAELEEHVSSKVSEQSVRDETLIYGVVFAKTVRSSFACLHVAQFSTVPSDLILNRIEESETEHLLVRIQFPEKCGDNLKALRSFCRRTYKQCDLVSIKRWRTNDEKDRACDQVFENLNQWDRIVVDVGSLEEVTDVVRVEKARFWSIQRCQTWQQKLLSMRSLQGGFTCDEGESTYGLSATLVEKSSRPSTWIDMPRPDGEIGHHGGKGLLKREQGQFIARFLVHMVMKKLSQSNYDSDPFSWATEDPWKVDADLFQKSIKLLCSGSGVVDAAGGAGHVSMALGTMGVRSTVVDPRSAALPGRDRKVWNRILRRQASQKAEVGELVCLPVQYNKIRAWFGSCPIGVDERFRNPDCPDGLPVCDINSEVLRSCTAIVALHPDEATGSVVDVAVNKRVPMVVVPCCVFSRLFPDRLKPGSSQPVSSYEDLLQYLAFKDPSIQRAELPFIGANTVLYSTF